MISALIIVGALVGAADAPGPHAVLTASFTMRAWVSGREGQRQQLPFDVYCPDDDDEHVLVALVHDVGGARSDVSTTARHLASHGFVVVAPEQRPEVPTQPLARWVSELNGLTWDVLEQVVVHVAQTPGPSAAKALTPPKPPWTTPRCRLQQGLEGIAFAEVGVGAGAMAATKYERSSASGLRLNTLARVHLDGVDDPDLLEQTAQGARFSWGSDGFDDERPPYTLVLRAEPSRCNQDGDVRALFDTALVGSQRAMAKVPGASHCDAAEPFEHCPAACGASTPERRALFRRELTNWLLAHTSGRPAELLAHDVEEVRRAGPRPPSERAHWGFNASAVGGVALGVTSGAELALGFRPELTLPRRSKASLGVGPYLEVMTTSSFHDLVLGGGATVVTPWFVAPSVGGWARDERGAWSGGLSAGVFVGWRRFNDISAFDGCVGLRGDVRIGLGASSLRAVVIALQLDLTNLVAAAAWALH